MGITDWFKAEDSEQTKAEDESLSHLYSGRHDPNKDPTASQRFRRTEAKDLNEKEVPAIHDTSWLFERVVEDRSEYATKEGAEVDVTAKDGDESRQMSEDEASDLMDEFEDRLDDERALDAVEDTLLEALDEQESGDGLTEDQAARVEDRIQEWVEDNDVMVKLKELNNEEYATGTGAIVFRNAERGPSHRSLRDPVMKPIRIEQMNVIGEHEMADIDPDLDPLSMTYKTFRELTVYRRFSTKVQGDSGVDRKDINDARLHPDRFVAMRTRWSKLEPRWGISIFRRLRTMMQTFMNAEWVVGQIVWRLIFKVLTMNLDGFDDEAQKQVAQNMIQEELDALSLTIQGQDDNLEFKSPLEGLSGLGDLWEMMKELLSVATSTPKSQLFGNQAGEVAGAEQDMKTYFQDIEAHQDNNMTPVLRQLIDFALRCEEEIVLPPGVDRDDIDYSITWNKIHRLGEQERANVEHMKAQTDEIRQRIVSQLQARGIMQKEEAAEMVEEMEFIETATPGAAAAQQGFGPGPGLRRDHAPDGDKQ